MGPILASVGAMQVAAMPLILCWYLLHGLRSQSEDVASEVLIGGFVAEHPLLPPPDRRHALDHHDEPTADEQNISPPF